MASAIVPDEVLAYPTMQSALIAYNDRAPTLYVEICIPRTLVQAFIAPEQRRAAQLELFKQLRDHMDGFLNALHDYQGGT